MGNYIIVILLAAILAVLVGGIVLMGIGGEANKKYGHKLMVARVSLQGLALLLLFLLFFTGKH